MSWNWFLPPLSFKNYFLELEAYLKLAIEEYKVFSSKDQLGIICFHNLAYPK